MQCKFVFKFAVALILFLQALPYDGNCQPAKKKDLITTGKFVKIYDPSVGEKDSWYINDHAFMKGPDGKWHMIGITGMDSAKPWDESNFAHAVADSLTGKWTKKPFVLSVSKEVDETVLWAPHIIKHEDTYYMYYCGGHQDHRRYQINLATSKDLEKWSRYPGNPLFVDGYDGRDPFVFYDEFNKRWVIYYTATSKPERGAHIVAARISYDLVNWSKDRYVVFRDTTEKGTWGGNTESPQVIHRGDYYYLFIGPGASYKTTKVYRSRDMFNWDMDDEVATLDTHAAEIIQDKDKWYISSCGLLKGGLYLAPLYWND
ncbi:MAG: family 43 glycosylhydrolase [Chitinophagaceae bacterium]|nr:family 43 glycosylhydrolase [Chitinophagaceae bacterium]